MNAYITAAESVTPHNFADLIEALAALLDSIDHSQSAASIGSHACPNHLSLASMLLADPLLGSHSWSCPSCSLPKRNSIHCARAASSSSSCLFPQCSSLYTQQPCCSHQPFYTFPLLLASFHRSLLSASTQRFVQRTKLLCLPVWLSSASALVTTPEGIVCTGCFWWCHSCMDTCDESNGFWLTSIALDTATNSLTQTQTYSSKPGSSPFSLDRQKQDECRIPAQILCFGRTHVGPRHTVVNTNVGRQQQRYKWRQKWH